jgi:acyl carrier protein
MNNQQKLIVAFNESLKIPLEKINDELVYGAEGWDSVGHMILVASIETAFDIMISTEDVIDLSSFGKAKEIIAKYGIDINA